ncbi:MAG: Ig-like domain-containing protein [Prevotella sp.]|nr:Ig-like domain-containing protein [Prevotella sp.]
MKKNLLRLSTLCLLAMLFAGGAYALRAVNEASQPQKRAAAEFVDIKADFMNGSFFTAAETSATTAGLKMNADGTFTRVAADAEEANAVITGKFHSNDHGISNFSATVKVAGPVKITLGTCAWGGNVTVTGGTVEVATFNTNTGACYHNNKEANVISAYYKGEAATLTISGGSYVPYFAVEAVNASDIPNDAKVTFDIANAGAEGVAPAEQTIEIGGKLTIPANRTLWVEGKTLTAWTDGTNQYKAGDEMTINENLTLTPVFSENEVSFADRTEEVTATWDFQQKNGAVALGIEGKTGFVVTQISVNGKNIDFRLDIDATSGKYNNKSWQDWAQVNSGTKFTLPIYKGTVVSTFSMGDNSETTFADEKGVYENNVNTYTYNGSGSTLDIIINGGSYYRWVKAVYPVPAAEGSGFTDIKADFMNGSFFTAAETSATTAGLKMNADGTFTRVAADAEDANAVISGKFHSNDHGISGFSATVKVEGTVKITFGTCAWGGDVTVTNADGTTVAKFNTNTGACYHQNKETNIISAYYKQDVATTLTISGGSYVPYFAVEKVDPKDVPSDVKIIFDAANAGAEGTAPAEETVAIGKDYTLPKNFTLYKEGSTLTGWTDGTNTYAPGQTIKAPDAESVTLTPVFTANEVTLADRTEAVTVKFDFMRQDGAPTVGYQNATGIWVAQATVNGKAIDVKADFDTNNGGKFANGAWNDWAQLNKGTKFTIPSCKGATVSVEAYNELGTGDGKTYLTIDGQSDYTPGKTISYEVANKAETIDVVIGDEGSYYRYIQVVLPVVQSQGGGETFDNAEATITWPLNDSGNISQYTATPDGAFSTVAVNTGDLEITGVATRTADTAAEGISFVKFRPSGSTKAVEWVVKPAAGLTFAPTKISLWIQRFGTDAENGVTVTAKVGEGEAITLGNYTAPRANQGTEKDKYAKNENYTNQVVINLTEEQQTALKSGEALTLSATVGVGESKEGGFSDVQISGTVSGTKAAVEMYTLAAVASPEEGGSINVYPKSDEYEADTEVTLTATENFGYDFVNWTNAAGEEVSTEAKFKYTVKSNETLTANFKKVNTYELKLTVDGTNDYMVTVSPKPDLVDGKWMYEEGAAVVLTANQYEGLVTFNNWSDGTTNSELTVKMTENTNITAVYSEADIVAGWDFYTAGGNGRKADFAAEDNDGDALNLVNTETGETSGWLDKSAANGGYESFKGAAVNWRTGTQNGDVGHWHWQTKVNAEAFTDINVQFDMLYNYNAYQKYNAEYSLDGENWTGFGSITMEGAKNAASFSQKLPEAANNQKELYIRMLADKTSNVDGSASANDGNSLAMFFITGTPKLVDDPVAPALVSSVPAKGATGASASGKIVLTFDKKVKIADGAKGKLGDAELTPAVSGKVITFEYKGLDYATEYTFTLPANTVSNLTGATLADAITLTFTTMDRPTVTKAPYDVTVSNVEELLAAINTANTRADQNTRFRIFIKKGTYTIPLSSTMKTCNNYEVPECITFITGKNISFIGEDRDETVITNAIPADATFAGTYGTTSKYDGIGNSDVFQISSSAEGLYWQDLTVSTGMEDSRGRDIAIQDKGKKNIYKNVCLHGYQDTWTSNNDYGLYYFEGGVIRGRTDYICGKGDIYFNQVEFKQIAGGYCAVPSKPAKVGWVMKDCTINGDGDGVDGNYTLGRPWGSGTPVAVWIDTKMNVQPSAIGWNEMSGGWPARFAEYNSTTSTGSTIDLSGRKKTFGDGHANNPVLTAAEAADYSDMSKMYGDWQPTLLTEQAPVVTEVKFEGTTLSWTGNNYSLLYAICKDGDVVGFTTDTSIDVSTLTTGSASSAPRRAESSEAESWSVRAANEMGGLSQAVNINGVVTGISATKPAVENRYMDGAIYTLQGVRVTNPTKGLYIINGRKVVIK